MGVQKQGALSIPASPRLCWPEAPVTPPIRESTPAGSLHPFTSSPLPIVGTEWGGTGAFSPVHEREETEKETEAQVAKPSPWARRGWQARLRGPREGASLGLPAARVARGPVPSRQDAAMSSLLQPGWGWPVSRGPGLASPGCVAGPSAPIFDLQENRK